MEAKSIGGLGVVLLGIAAGFAFLGDAGGGSRSRASVVASASEEGLELGEARLEPAGETAPVPERRSALSAEPAAPALPTRLAVLALVCRSASGEEGQPVAGVELVAGLLRGAKGEVAEEQPLARGESDGAGRARFELAVPIDGAPPGSTRVYARVGEAGFQERRVERTLERAVSETEPLVIVAAPGGTARGIVTDERGAPAASELVLLERDPPGVGRHAARMSSRARVDGSFELHVPRSAVYSVVARASGLGSGARRDITLDVAYLPQDLRITIGGTGVLEGVLADPQGEPIRETSLNVTPADLGRMPSREERYERELEGGLCNDSTRTGLDGRFRFTGLRPGDYVLTRGAGEGETTIGGPYATGTAALATLSLHRLELRILDAEGHLLALEKDERSGESFLSDERVSCRLESPRTAEERLQQDIEASSRVARVLADETVVYTLEAGRSYVVMFNSPSAPLQLVRFETSPHVCLVRREIRLGVPCESGELRLTILDPDGRPLGALESNQVYVREAESGQEVVTCKQSWRSSGNTGSSFRCSLALGRYVVRVEAEPFEGCIRRPGEPPVAKFSPAEREFEILAGRPTDLEISLRGSGRLELTAIGGRGSPRPLVSYADSGLDWDTWMEDVRARAEGVRVRLTQARDGADLPVRFFVGLPLSLTTTSSAEFSLDGVLEPHELPWILHDLPHRSSSPIPPGDYGVEVELPDGRALSGRARIEAGVTTSLVLSP